MLEHFDRAAYLERIGLQAAPPVTLDGLIALQWAQLTAIPFENLDISLGRLIDPSPEAIFAKLVTGKRGGYCHECNGLLHQALLAFGFTARPLLARVMQGDDSPITALTHTTILVELPEGPHLADAGFGAQTPRLPLALSIGSEGSRDGMTWRIDADPLFAYRLSLAEGQDWKRLYCFDLTRVLPPDTEQSNYWSCSHPGSHFTQGPLAVRHLAGGRNTLVAGHVSRHRGDKSERTDLPDLESLLKHLRSDFGLTLVAGDEEMAELDRMLAKSRLVSLQP